MEYTNTVRQFEVDNKWELTVEDKDGNFICYLLTSERKFAMNLFKGFNKDGNKVILSFYEVNGNIMVEKSE